MIVDAESVRRKLHDYLLNRQHPVGSTKALWFEQALGFTRQNADSLISQIRFEPENVVCTGASDYGQKYEQVSTVVGVNGKQIDVLFVWLESPAGTARLITAFPAAPK